MRKEERKEEEGQKMERRQKEGSQSEKKESDIRHMGTGT